MNVGELIERLRRMPQWLDVCVWDEDADDYVPVAEALWEDGHTSVDLIAVGVEMGADVDGGVVEGQKS